MTAEDSLRRAEGLLERLEQARAQLETAKEPEAAIEILNELSELAKEIEAEVARAKRDADADA